MDKTCYKFQLMTVVIIRLHKNVKRKSVQLQWWLMSRDTPNMYEYNMQLKEQ